MKAKTVPPLWLLRTALVLFFPLIAFGIIASVIVSEGRKALRQMRLELKLEFGSVRDFWNNVR